MATHCLPNGLLGTGELPVCNISAPTMGIYNATTGNGNRRGVAVICHPLEPTGVSIPVPIVDGGTPGFQSYLLSLATNLATDGWQVIVPAYQEDNYVTNPSAGIYNDFNNDTTFGGRYVLSTLHWWDHVVDFVQSTYGNWPIIVVGYSEGAYRAMQIAVNKQSTIKGFVAHEPLTVWSNILPALTTPTNFGVINTSGADISATYLNSVTVPGVVGYGTSDEVVAYSGFTTIGSGSGSTVVNGTNFSGSQSLTLTLGTSFVSGLQGVVTLTSLTGGTGRAVLLFSGVSGNTLTNCTYVGGSGTLNPGVTVVTQSTTAALIAAAGTTYVTPNITSETHELTPADSGTYVTSTASPVALSAATTLTVATTSGLTGSTGLAAVYASDNLWHTLSFTGSTGTTFTTCTYSGTQSATIVNGSPVCLVGTGSPPVGSTHPLSYPYWVSQVIDPLCPKQY